LNNLATQPQEIIGSYTYNKYNSGTAQSIYTLSVGEIFNSFQIYKYAPTGTGRWRAEYVITLEPVTL
jgi:hypothetical protein